MFAAVDTAALSAFLSSILPAMAGLDPFIAGVGALILFVVQKMGGHQLNVWGTIKYVFSLLGAAWKTGPTPAPGPALDLTAVSPAGQSVLSQVLDQVKALEAGKGSSLGEEAKALWEAVMAKAKAG